jgi:hypothetical protein
LLLLANEAAENARNVTVCVEVKSFIGKSFGSGILITRELRNGVGGLEKFNFVLTAGHVVNRGRISGIKKTDKSTEQIIVYPSLSVAKVRLRKRTLEQESVVANLVRNGKIHDDIDVAVLILKTRLSEESAKFDLNEPCVGTEVYHCASFPGKDLVTTSGMVSAVYSPYEDGIYHQADCRVKPGSSGGGMFLQSNGDCVGVSCMLTDLGGAFVPSILIYEWLEEHKLEWLMDESLDCPSFGQVERMECE